MSEPGLWGLRDSHDFFQSEVKSFNQINLFNPGPDKFIKTKKSTP
jgi:hypothetical protein